jgi:hypothetical protein
MDSVAPPGENVRGVMYAWSSAVYDSDRDQLVVFGGGHTDYSGNEVYAFGPISGGAAKWRRLTDPSNPPAQNRAYGPDGRPVSRHTYGNLDYLPAPANKMVSCTVGSRYSDGSGDSATDFFDLAVDPTVKEPWSRAPGPPINTYTYNSFCVYNPLSNSLFFHDASSNRSSLQEYRLDKQKWVVHSQYTLDHHYTAAVDTSRNLLVATGGGGGVRVWSLRSPDSDSYAATTAGPKVVESLGFPGFVFDTLNRQFVGWGGDANVYTLTVPSNPGRGAWAWAPVPVAAGNTVVPTQQSGLKTNGYVTGTFGRFRYVPAAQGVVLVNNTDEDVYFFKLPGNGAVPSSTVPSPVSVIPSDTAAAAPPAAAAAASTTEPTVLESRSRDRATAPIVSVRFRSRSTATQRNVAVTFGQAFRAGDVAADQPVVARLADGTALPLQFDKKASYADGSVRHAVLTVLLPTLPGRGVEEVALAGGSEHIAGESIVLDDLLKSAFDTTVSLKMGGVTYRASAREALAARSLQFLRGPLVSEWIAGGPVKTSDGVVHPHLAAYFHVRAYGKPVSAARVDVVLENNWTLVPSPQDFTYDVSIQVPGDVGYARSALTHYAHARWHQRLWWGTAPSVYAQLDLNYLQSTKLIPSYEAVRPDGSYLSSLRASTEPMRNGDLTAHMDDTGAQDDIAPLPRWDAVYAVSGDVRAYDAMLANADGAAAYGVHYRDETTGLPATVDSYPNSSLIDPDSSTPVIPEGRSANPYSPGSWSSHQPSIGFLAYLVTGDYFYLEEMQFWSAYNLLWVNADYRRHALGLWYTGSLRGEAWAYRSLAQAAVATPDMHPLRPYLAAKLLNNIQNDTRMYVEPGGKYKNGLGAMYMAEGNEQYRFYDYFMSWAMQYLVDLGFTQAVPLRDYKLQFPIGLMGMAPNEYCFQLAPQYTWKAGPGGTDTFYTSFREVYENTTPAAAGLGCGTSKLADLMRGPVNGMSGNQTAVDSYYANLQAALAAAYDSGLLGGRTAWKRLLLSGRHPDYSNAPQWALVPHTLPAAAR